MPPTPIMAGNGPLPPGRDMVAVKEIDFPPSDTLTVRTPPDSEPLTEEGLGGRAPNSYF